jgi:hypothetical protein
LLKIFYSVIFGLKNALMCIALLALIYSLRGPVRVRRTAIIFSIKRGMDRKPRISAVENEIAGLLIIASAIVLHRTTKKEAS